MMQVTITRNFTDLELAGLLCCAFEGGTGYWCRINDFICPEGTKKSDFYEGGTLSAIEGEYFHWCETVPLCDGGALILEDQENGKGDEYRLDRRMIQRGLEVMAEKYPQHFVDITSGADAITGDVFLQCALFGEIIYG